MAPDSGQPDFPKLPEPDRLDRLVTVLDSAIGGGGWYQPHRLVSVEPDPNSPDDAFLLGQMELPEGDHPLDYLLGFVAPSSWLAFGAVCFGWAAPPQGLDDRRETVRSRPSAHPERRRARIVTLVDRDGSEHSTTNLDDGTVIDEMGRGVVSDALRRCLSLPTSPPAVSTLELFAGRWLVAIAGVRRRRNLSWPDAAALHPAYKLFDAAADTQPETLAELGRAFAIRASWEELRRRTAAGRAQLFRLDPELAGWMDDGMFARWVLAEEPRLPTALNQATTRLTPTARQGVETTLADWGFSTPSGDAAA